MTWSCGPNCTEHQQAARRGYRVRRYRTITCPDGHVMRFELGRYTVRK